MLLFFSVVAAAAAICYVSNNSNSKQCLQYNDEQLRLTGGKAQRLPQRNHHYHNQNHHHHQNQNQVNFAGVFVFFLLLPIFPIEPSYFLCCLANADDGVAAAFDVFCCCCFELGFVFVDLGGY